MAIVGVHVIGITMHPTDTNSNINSIIISILIIISIIISGDNDLS